MISQFLSNLRNCFTAVKPAKPAPIIVIFFIKRIYGVVSSGGGTGVNLSRLILTTVASHVILAMLHQYPYLLKQEKNLPSYFC